MNNTTASNSEGFTDCLQLRGQPASTYNDLAQEPWIRYSFIGIWSVLIFVTLIGNLLVILTIVCNASMRTVTNYYILNLGITDFLVALLVMPLKLVEMTAPCAINRWVFTKFSCSIVSYVLMVLVFTSLLTLVVISIERFFAIVYPLSSRVFHSRSRTFCYIALTWTIPALFSLPTGILGDVKPYHFLAGTSGTEVRSQICEERFPVELRYGYVLTAFVGLFLAPLLLIATTSTWIIKVLLQPINMLPKNDDGHHQHGKNKSMDQCMTVNVKKEINKRRVATMIMIVALVYFVSWTPWFVINIIALFNANFFDSNFFFMRLSSHLFGFLNSASNPLIYYFMSEKFRLGFRRIISAMLQCKCSRHHLSMDSTRGQSNNYSAVTSNKFAPNATKYSFLGCKSDDTRRVPHITHAQFTAQIENQFDASASKEAQVTLCISSADDE